MISVILPTYNRAKWLSQSIESIIAQDYKDWELIVVDDASSDNTGEIVKDFMKKNGRIRYVRNIYNKKLPASLNVGMHQARGEYITWTSDDNLYKSNAFSVMMNAMKNCSVTTGLVFAEYDVIDKDGNKVKEYKIPKDIGELYWRNIIGCAFLYKKEVIEKIGWYDEKRFLIEDYDYWLRIADYFDIQPIRQNIYFLRVHTNSLTTTRAHEVLQLKYKLLNENLKRRINDKIRRRIYQERALICYELDDYDRMHQCVKEGRDLYPDIDFHKRVKRAMILGETFTKIYKKLRFNVRLR